MKMEYQAILFVLYFVMMWFLLGMNEIVKKNTELSKGDRIRMAPGEHVTLKNHGYTWPIDMWVSGIGEVVKCEDGQIWVKWDSGLETIHQSEPTNLVRVEDE